MRCRQCDAIDVYIVQVRKNLRSDRDIYRCRGCGHRFTPNHTKMRHNPVVRAAALHVRTQGYSLSETVGYLQRNFRITVTRKTILDWAKGRRTPRADQGA